MDNWMTGSWTGIAAAVVGILLFLIVVAPSAHAEEPVTIDILVVYTQEWASQNRDEKDRAETIIRAIDETNRAFTSNDLPIVFRLVGTHETDYVELGASKLDLSATINALWNTADGKMDDVPAARDKAGADMLVFMTLHLYTQGVSATSSPTSYEACQRQVVFVRTDAWASGEYALAHELCHAMGCPHVLTSTNIMSQSLNQSGIFVQESKDKLLAAAPIIAAWRLSLAN